MLRGEDVISLETVAKTVLAATSKDVVEDGPKVKSSCAGYLWSKICLPRRDVQLLETTLACA